jgi:hypothetical protein
MHSRIFTGAPSRFMRRGIVVLTLLFVSIQPLPGLGGMKQSEQTWAHRFDIAFDTSAVVNASVNSTIGSAVVTNDGGIVILSHIAAPPESTLTGYLSVIKTSAAGQPQWQKALALGTRNSSSSIRTSRDGSILIAGSSFARFDAGFAPQRAWILKMSLAGDILWQRAVRKAPESDTYVWDFHEREDGDITVFATTGSYPNFVLTAIRISPTGQIIDERMLFEPAIPPAHIAAAPDGSVAVLTPIDGSFGKVYQIARFRPDLTPDWRRTYNFGTRSIWLSKFTANSDGSYSATGYWTPQAAGQPVQALAMQITADGTIGWNKAIGSDVSRGVFGKEIVAGAPGQTLVAGVAYITSTRVPTASFSIPWITALDTTGNVQWQHTYGEPTLSADFGHGPRKLIRNADSTWIVIGNTGVVSEPRMSLWLMRMSATGELDSHCSYHKPITLTFEGVATETTVSTTVEALPTSQYQTLAASIVTTSTTLSTETLCAQSITMPTAVAPRTTSTPSATQSASQKYQRFLPVIGR